MQPVNTLSRDAAPELVRTTGQSRGFTMVEALFAIGTALVILGFIVTSAAKTKTTSMTAVSLSNIRQLSLGLHTYAEENRDQPPSFGSPQWPAEHPWHFEFGDVGTGNWFEQTWLASYALTAELGDTAVANAPGRTDRWRIVTYQGRAASLGDYLLSSTLYAHPDFFNWTTRRGASQFGTQHLSQVVFPSDKGLFRQTNLFNYPSYGPVPACCIVDLPSPVAFADHSASLLVLRMLPRGIFNLYAPNAVPTDVDPRRLQGEPIMDTPHGIRGRDRK